MITSAQKLMMARAGAGGAVNATYDGGTSIAGAASLSGSFPAGALVIFAAMDDIVLDEVEQSYWSGMISEFPSSNTSNSIVNVVGYKTATSGESNTVTTVRNGSPLAVDAILMVGFSNVGTPPSTPTSTQTASGSAFSVPSMTVTEEGSMVLIVAFIDDDDATISQVPSGYTLAVQNGRLGGSIAIMYQLDMPAGSTGTVVGSWSGNDALLTYGCIIPPA